jgi:phage tail-like protein
MDANGTRFHLLLGQGDWAGCLDGEGVRLGERLAASADAAGLPLEWDAAQGVLQLRARLFRFRPTGRVEELAPEARRGAARDRYGNWYWIADDGRGLLARSAAAGARPARFWPVLEPPARPAPTAAGFRACPPPAPAAAPPPLRGLAITEDHYLVAGVLEPPGLLVFDLHSSGGPRMLPWPMGVEFAPWDMAARPGGGLWVLDRDHARLWAVDRRFRPARAEPPPGAPAVFQPLGHPGARRMPARLRPEGVLLATAAAPAGLDAVAVEALPDGSALLLVPDLGDGFAGLYRFAAGAVQEPPASTAAVLAQLEEADRAPGRFRLRGHDLALLPAAGQEPMRVLVAPGSGDQAFPFALRQDDAGRIALESLPDYLPMRLFGGRALVGAGTQAWYDSGEGPRWVPLVAQPRPRFAEEGSIFSPMLDGGEPGCVWHRLMLDMALPPEAEVEVWSAAAEEPATLFGPDAEALPADLAGGILWRREPRPLPRAGGASELPFLDGAAARCAPTHELLFQAAQGRYLRLRLVLRGNGRVTPRLRALRAWYPRFSYRDRYLPAIYREEGGPAGFLERFLANPEGMLTSIEDRIAAVQILVDPGTAPAEALDWLGRWFGMAMDPGWEEARRRLLLRHAAALFAARGTVRGLQLALHLALDACLDEDAFATAVAALPGRPEDPYRIIERFRTRSLPPALLGLTGDAVAPGAMVPAGSRWRPEMGGEALHRRYREALGLGPDRLFPVLPPGPAEAPAWAEFAEATLSFVPEAAPAAAWRGFLARRYRGIAALNAAYGTALAGFEGAVPPLALPPDGAPLRDWAEFQGLVLARARLAHRFTVMLPVRAAERADPARRLAQQALARRVIEAEKPAHTAFEVGFYWALFRVGEARLGRDTLLDRGSRAPELMPPVLLGGSHLGEAFLEPGHPWNLPDRVVLGRDRVSGTAPLGGP